MPKEEIVPRRKINSAEGWISTPEKSIPIGLSFIEFELDRSDVVDGDKKQNLLEMEMEMSLDGGKTWGGVYTEEIESGAIKSYPLLIKAKFPDGVQELRGQIMTKGWRGTEIPQPSNPDRMVRCKLKTFMDKTLSASLVTK